MAFDGNGNWISNFSAESDRDAGYKILASRFDNIFIADIAQSFENCLTKDAQVKPIQPFDANNFRIINVANPSANTDAVNLATLNTKDGTAVHKAGTETISGNKTFSGTNTFSGDNTFSGTNTFTKNIVGSITGNAGTVTNGVYTTGNQTISGTKTFSSTISGSITGNAGTVTNGVYTTGNQTISGKKTFNTVNGIQTSVSGSNNIIQVNTAANLTDTTRNENYTNTFAVTDKNDLVASQVGTTFRTDGGVKLYMQARNRSTGSQVTGEINVMVDKDGNVITYAPTPATNDNSTKISTTAWVQSWANTNNAGCLSTWSKGGNGYFKFKNGLTIQFGTFSGSGNPTITFPTAFSTTNYTILAACLRDVSDTYSMTYNNKTTTTVSIHTQQWDGNWLAIGY